MRICNLTHVWVSDTGTFSYVVNLMVHSAEKKKTQNWFQRQFFRQMSQDYNSGEYTAAVAINSFKQMSQDYDSGEYTAAVAINSLEKLSIADQKSMSEGPSTSLTKIKSKTEDTKSQVPEDAKVPRRFLGKNVGLNIILWH